MSIDKLLDENGREVEVDRATWLEAHGLRVEAEIDRCWREGVLYNYGFPAVPLTVADVDRAARIVVEIASIESLSVGVVGFDHGLRGGWWYHKRGDAYLWDRMIVVEIPESIDFESCRAVVLAGIARTRQAVRDFIAHEPKEDHRPSELQLRALQVATTAVA